MHLTQLMPSTGDHIQSAETYSSVDTIITLLSDAARSHRGKDVVVGADAESAERRRRACRHSLPCVAPAKRKHHDSHFDAYTVSD